MGVPALWRAAVVGMILAWQASAGFMSVSVTAPVQCQNATVTWTGDEGPWHLLLTPTDFIQSSYNLWVPEIPSTATNWTIPINQPAGMNFMITMWGSSGIRFAGTTDVMSVGRPVNATNATCFLTDAQILSLYTFSFNISDASGSYPPECSNLSMVWPSSLDIGGAPMARNYVDLPALAPRQAASSEPAAPLATSPSSSDRTGGNTTKPPTMFGIIPLGNSFSIPITYPDSYSDRLPGSVISNNPTTWTRRGITHLNWTIGLSKGTRFILVAGIGDDKQWASGGSSQMMTVGQGDMSCYGWTDPTGVVTDVPSITGSSTSSATAMNNGDNLGPPSGPKLGAAATAIVSVLSVVVTLVLVGICFCCYRIRRRRRKAAQLTAFEFRPSPVKKKSQDDDIPLDILSPSDARPRIDTSPHMLARSSPETPTANHNHPQTATSYSGTIPSPIDRIRAQTMGRQTSQDHLLSGTSPTTPVHSNTHTYTGFSGAPLRPMSRNDLPRDGVTDLKLETLAQFDRDGPSSPSTSSGPRTRRQLPEEEEDMEYVVHRDAGRVRELPPRYEEMNWEAERRVSEIREQEERDRAGGSTV